MATESTERSLEASLAEKLGAMPKESLRSIAESMSKLGAIGFRADDVFEASAKGVEVRGHIDGDNIGDLGKLIPVLNPRSITIFPRGIIRPDVYRVHLQLSGK